MFLRRSLPFILLLLLLLVFFIYTQSVSPQTAPFPSPSPAAASPSPSPTPEPSATSQPFSLERYNGEFELPLQGATGFTAVEIDLRSAPNDSSAKVLTLPAGSAFQIIRQEGNWWYVSDAQHSGYVAHRHCMINLPDIIPSIVYDNTNAYESKILSSGKQLPGITGEALYENLFFNQRLEKEEFIMPVLYAMAPKIQAAQRTALADGNSLKIYEAYRPYQAQRKVVDAMATLSTQDKAVMAGISTPPWKVSWFISQGISHHQRGCAIDVSLVKVNQTESRRCGMYEYDEVTAYTEYKMPTAIHELSSAAAVFTQPVSALSRDAWRSAEYTSSFNEAAQLLQTYCTDAGLTPLASEWWHFNDLDGYAQIKEKTLAGKFVLTELLSTAPDAP